MNTLEDLEIDLPFEIQPSGNDKNKAKLPRKKDRQKRNLYPVLIVDTLPKSFGKIDKIDTKKRPNISKEEAILLNLIARIIVEIFIKEEL